MCRALRISEARFAEILDRFGRGPREPPRLVRVRHERNDLAFGHRFHAHFDYGFATMWDVDDRDMNAAPLEFRARVPELVYAEQFDYMRRRHMNETPAPDVMFYNGAPIRHSAAQERPSIDISERNHQRDMSGLYSQFWGEYRGVFIREVPELQPPAEGVLTIERMQAAMQALRDFGPIEPRPLMQTATEILAMQAQVEINARRSLFTARCDCPICRMDPERRAEVERRSEQKTAAHNKSITLLLEWLSPEQLAQYEKDGSFKVIGCDTGNRYRIMPLSSVNVYLLGRGDGVKGKYCFLPEGASALGDIMLSQKLALENYENDALRVANWFPNPVFFG